MKQGTCKYFKGIRNKACGGGINLRDLVGGENNGWLLKTPCFESHKSEIKCERFSEPTEEELAADAAEWDKAIKRVTEVMPVVNEWRNKEPTGKSEIIECPICKGRLHLAQAACNGHVHAKCETDDCVAFME